MKSPFYPKYRAFFNKISSFVLTLLGKWGIIKVQDNKFLFTYKEWKK